MSRRWRGVTAPGSLSEAVELWYVCSARATADDDDAKPSTEDAVMSDIQRLIDASSGARRLSDDEADARDVEWTAPAGQSGDGTSALNKKLGY